MPIVLQVNQRRLQSCQNDDFLSAINRNQCPRSIRISVRDRSEYAEKKALKCIDKAQKKLDVCLDDDKIKKKAKAKTKDMNKKIDSFAKAFDKCQVECDKCVDKCDNKKECIEKCNKTQLKCANKAAKKYGK